MSSPKRPAGAVVSDKGTQLAPLSHKYSSHTTSGDKFHAQDILTLPRPIQTGQQSQPSQPQSISWGNPNSPEFLSTGPHLTIIDHSRAVRWANARPLKRRPKNSIRNNKSSFVSRGVVSDQFSRRFKPDELSDCLVVSNLDRSLVFSDFGLNGNKLDPSAKVFFTKEWPSCHAFNPKTATAQQLDSAVGMSSGDLVWIDIPSQKYERVNKHQQIASAILALAWIPNTDTLIAAAHADGTLVIYDVAADESPVRATFPVGKRVTELVFLEPSKLLIANRSDYLRILHSDTGMIREFVPSSFGSILSVSLSPDGKYWASGGEDDYIEIYEVATRRLIARLVGHRAWVNSISWDQVIIGDNEIGQNGHQHQSSSTDIYRLATSGEDRQVILWEFSPSMSCPPACRSPTVPIDKAQSYVAQTHSIGVNGGPPIVLGRTLEMQASTLSPTDRACPEVPEYGESQLSKSKISANNSVISCRDGRFSTWRRESQSLQQYS